MLGFFLHIGRLHGQMGAVKHGGIPVKTAETVITSSSNARIKRLMRLRDRAERDRSGLVLVEGFREILRAADAGIALKELYYCGDLFLGEHEEVLINRVKSGGAALFPVAEAPFRKASYRDRPDGLIATAARVGRQLSGLTVSQTPLLVIAQSIEKPGNLGAILRSADASGADAVLVCDGATDVNNPNVVRASTGALFTIPVVETSTAEALAWLRTRGIGIVAASPHAATCYTDADFTKPVAVAVGAEQYGLKDDLLEAADVRVKIPMAGTADSLNASVAATVLLFEAARQRGFSAKPANKRDSV